MAGIREAGMDLSVRLLGLHQGGGCGVQFAYSTHTSLWNTKPIDSAFWFPCEGSQCSCSYSRALSYLHSLLFASGLFEAGELSRVFFVPRQICTRSFPVQDVASGGPSQWRG